VAQVSEVQGTADGVNRLVRSRAQYAESDFTPHIYYATTMVPLGSALPIDCRSAALYVQPTLGGKLRTVLQTMLVTVGASVIRYSSVQFLSYLKQDISYPLFLLCFRTAS